MGYYNEFNSVLSTAKKEQDISPFLKQHIVLIERLKGYWNGCASKAEFRIGPNYRADFVVLSACSGSWECLLIELQGPCDPIFIKNGDASKGLREAQHQIQDWGTYISENMPAFRSQLAELARDLPAFCSRADLHQKAETELRDSRTYIKCRYMVIIGRRNSLNADTNQRRNKFLSFEIVTFDRLLDEAKKLDEAVHSGTY